MKIRKAFNFSLYKNLIVDSWSKIKSSYWFIPTIFCFSGIALAYLLVNVDSQINTSTLEGLQWLTNIQPEGARAILTTIAGSTITVAGVIFSMTLLSVSHASSQIGPRVLSGFMNDRGNQVTLGIFIATYTYSLLVVKTIQEELPKTIGSNFPTHAFVPHLSVLGSLVLALLSILFFIYFVHHVPQTINMTKSVQRIGNQLLSGTKKLYPYSLGQEASRKYDLQFIKNTNPTHLLKSNQKGYITNVDGNNLIKTLSEYDLTAQMLKRPGDFICEEVPLLEVYGTIKDEKISDNILNSFIVAPVRSINQDIAFSIDLLVEVATRALSPGINDPFTAHECINQIQAGLTSFTKKKIPSSFRLDSKNKLRVFAEPYSFESLVNRSYGVLRHFIKNNPITTLHTAQSLKILRNSINQRYRPIINEQMKILKETINEANTNLDSLDIKKIHSLLSID